MAHIKGRPCTESNEVDVRGRGTETEIVSEYSHAGVVVVSTSFLGQEPRRYGDKDTYDSQPDTAFHSIYLPSTDWVPCLSVPIKAEEDKHKIGCGLFGAGWVV